MMKKPFVTMKTIAEEYLGNVGFEFEESCVRNHKILKVTKPIPFHVTTPDDRNFYIVRNSKTVLHRKVSN